MLIYCNLRVIKPNCNCIPSDVMEFVLSSKSVSFCFVWWSYSFFKFNVGGQSNGLHKEGVQTHHTHIREQGAASEAPATDSCEKICVWRSLAFLALSLQEPLCPILRQPDDKETGKRRECEVDGSLFLAFLPNASFFSRLQRPECLNACQDSNQGGLTIA